MGSPTDFNEDIQILDDLAESYPHAVIDLLKIKFSTPEETKLAKQGALSIPKGPERIAFSFLERPETKARAVFIVQRALIRLAASEIPERVSTWALENGIADENVPFIESSLLIMDMKALANFIPLMKTASPVLIQRLMRAIASPNEALGDIQLCLDTFQLKENSFEVLFQLSKELIERKNEQPGAVLTAVKTLLFSQQCLKLLADARNFESAVPYLKELAARYPMIVIDLLQCQVQVQTQGENYWWAPILISGTSFPARTTSL